MRRISFLLLALLIPTVALADDRSFMDLIRAGDYKALGKKLEASVDLDKADPALRKYLEMNIEYLKRNAEPRTPGEYVILVRGTKNDKPFSAPPESGGFEVLLPNSIRFMRTTWDARLARFDKYFSEATTTMGGDGEKLRELTRIIEHHKGGGLGKSSNSVKSVLISASVRGLPTFGPPFEIIKLPAERAIFNTKGLNGEAEVLIPFWLLPKEIVARVNSMAELEAHPLYKESVYRKLQPRSYFGNANVDNWAIIEANIREGRPPLEGVAGLNYALDAKVGANATETQVERFVAEVKALGGTVVRVAAGDPRLPAGALARTVLSNGHPLVFIPGVGQVVKALALVEEAIHVRQLTTAIRAMGLEAVEKLLRGATLGEREAVRRVAEWELEAKRHLERTEPTEEGRAEIRRAIRALEADVANPGTGPIAPRTIEELSRKTIPELVLLFGERPLPEGPKDKVTLIAELTGSERAEVVRVLASRPATAVAERWRVLDRERLPERESRGITELLRDRVSRDKVRRVR